jgi:hypothetical protein
MTNTQVEVTEREQLVAILADMDYNGGGMMRWTGSGEPTERAYTVADTILAAGFRTPAADGETEWMVRSHLPSLDRTWDSGVTDEETAQIIAAQDDDIKRTLLRRRPAGPWVPVESEEG